MVGSRRTTTVGVAWSGARQSGLKPIRPPSWSALSRPSTPMLWCADGRLKADHDGWGCVVWGASERTDAHPPSVVVGPEPTIHPHAVVRGWSAQGRPRRLGLRGLGRVRAD